MASSLQSRVTPLLKRVAKRVLSSSARSKVIALGYRVARLTTPGGSRPRVLFASERPGLEGNLVLIRDRLVERGLADRVQVHYSVRGTSHSRWDTLRTVRSLAGADVVLMDDHLKVLRSIHPSPRTQIVNVGRASTGMLDLDRAKQIADAYLEQHPALSVRRRVLISPARGDHAWTAADVVELAEACGDSVALLTRLGGPVTVPAHLTGRILDVSDVADINPLLRVADVLVSDDVALLSEFALFDKPMSFLARESAGGGVVPEWAQSAPGRVCESVAELADSIRARDHHVWKIDGYRRQHTERIATDVADHLIDVAILGRTPQRRAG